MENKKLQDIGQLVKKDLESKDYKHFTTNEKKFLIAYAQGSCSVTEASRICGLTRMTWYNFFKAIPKDPAKTSFKDYAENIQEMDLDFAEGQLRFLMKGQYIYRKDENGNIMIDAEGEPIREYLNEIDTTAVIFKLKTHGKKRGYTQRHEITGAEGQPLGGFEINIKRNK